VSETQSGVYKFKTLWCAGYGCMCGIYDSSLGIRFRELTTILQFILSQVWSIWNYGAAKILLTYKW